MKTLMVLFAAVALAGCSNQAAKDYYEAVSYSSISLSETQVAKAQALAEIAASGDASTQAAAVMALALMPSPVIQPAYIESEALSYTKALAAPVAAIGALWIQSDLSRDLNDSNNKTAQAQISASSADQQALLSTLSTGSVASGVALDLAIGGIVDVSNTGMSTIESLQFDSNDLVGDLSETLQPIITPVVEIVPVEIVPVEIVPVQITPVIQQP
tara:strand:+ start:2516 stop:3160 length:645 start_codon:yes stop_codon:yes gene_type:complete